MGKNDLIKKFRLSQYDIDKDNDIMSFKEFKDLADTKCIIDYDGWGNLLYKHCLVNNAKISVDYQMICIDENGDRLLISFEEIDKLINTDLDVVWVNK